MGRVFTSEINSNLSMSHDVGNITGDCESCQIEISALTSRVNGINFALGQGDPVVLYKLMPVFLVELTG